LVAPSCRNGGDKRFNLTDCTGGFALTDEARSIVSLVSEVEECCQRITEISGEDLPAGDELSCKLGLDKAMPPAISSGHDTRI